MQSLLNTVGSLIEAAFIRYVPKSSAQLNLKVSLIGTFEYTSSPMYLLLRDMKAIREVLPEPGGPKTVLTTFLF